MPPLGREFRGAGGNNCTGTYKRQATD